MSDKNILLAGIWTIVMLIYLLGDVLRIFAGDFIPGQIGDEPATQGAMLFIAILMLIPILMIFVSLTAAQPFNRWVNIIVALGFMVFILASLYSFPGHYDKFLLLVSVGFNALTIWHAWHWTQTTP
jgi:hypothetical protein